ncbi:hypothetical protein BDV3_001874 [Batrachochytrium dendrobatidis]
MNALLQADLRTTQPESALTVHQRVKERISKIDAELLKNPLKDTFNRQHTYLRISLTERCNLRCTYCMPSEGVSLSPDNALLTTSEIIKLATLFVEQGVTKIRLTGGEPTVRKDLLDIVAGLNTLKSKGLKSIGMTTNGIALKKKLPGLLENGLDQLNISLDTLRSDRFEEMTRRKGMKVVLDAIKTAASMPFQAVKINSVIVRNTNDDEVADFVQLTQDLPIYVRFIEYMPFGGNKWDEKKFISYKELLSILGTKFSGITKLVDDPNDTSKAFQVDDFHGKFGFITSMSDHFCGTCNRFRLLADGNMKVCLFGNSEINLRDALRRGASNDELMQMVGMAIHRKKKQHADFDNSHVRSKLMAISAAGLKKTPVYQSRWIFSHKSMSDSHYLRPIRPASCYTSHRFNSTFSKNNTSSQAKLTHVNQDGRATMVDISSKIETSRIAMASARVLVGKVAFELVRDNKLSKGDVLTVAQIAGIQAAKQTGTLIPLCHPLTLTQIKVELSLCDATHAVHIRSMVVCSGKTGVEMEAIVAVSVAACTVYDMCKAVNKGIVITDVQLESKRGGKSGDYSRNGDQ